MGLDARKGRILAAIVSQYIQTGEPVGSKSICDLEGINVSSATVRNEMAALFDMGPVSYTHLSSNSLGTTTSMISQGSSSTSQPNWAMKFSRSWLVATV